MQSDIFLTNRLKNENKKVISPDSIDDSYNIQNYIIKNINKKVGAWKIGEETVINFENDDSFKMEVQDFVNAIKNKSKIKHGKSIDALQVLSLIENIYKSSR